MKFHVPEGATPIDDDEGLIPEELATYSDLCAVEAENILEAARRHLKRRKNADGVWLDEPFIRKVHQDMFGRVWDWAGRYRSLELRIGVAPERISEEIGRLIGDFRYWNGAGAKDMPVLERAVRLHHRLTWIHPFRNGNGRHARMAADIYLFSQNHPLPDWAADLSADGKARKRYIESIRTADAGDFAALLDYYRDCLPDR